MAAELGMSPTPLVQAFQQLEKEGLVECVPQWGVRVRVLTVHELKQLFGMRVAMESMVFRELASRAGEVANAVRDLRSLAEDVDRAAEVLRVEVVAGRRHVGEALLIDQQFHLTLAKLSGMDLVAREIDRLCVLPATVLALVPKNTPSEVSHVELLDAILSGDPDKAERAIKAAIESAAEYALPRLREQFGDGPISHAACEEDGPASDSLSS